MKHLSGFAILNCIMRVWPFVPRTALEAKDAELTRYKELLDLAIQQRNDAINAAKASYPDSLYAKLFPASSLARRAFYNLGAGNWRHPYWTNVDYASAYYNYDQALIDIHWDIASGEPLAVESESAELVYSSHTVEHLTNAHVDHMLSEAHRILKPGGVCRVTTPNAELIYWAYRRHDAEFNRHYGYDYSFGDDRPFNFSVERMPIWMVNEIATQLVQGVGDDFRGAQLMEQVDTIERIFSEHKTMEGAFDHFTGMIDFGLHREAPGNHINWWTNDKMVTAIKRSGFSHAVLSVAGGSLSPVMRNRGHFDIVDATYSIFVEGIK